MRRIALLGLALALSGCGYKTWWNPPFTAGNNPNQPVGDSENLLRAKGYSPEVEPLTTEPGDIWPGPLAPSPTMKDLVTQEGDPPIPNCRCRGRRCSAGPPRPTRRRTRVRAVRRRRAGRAGAVDAAIGASIVELRGPAGRATGARARAGR